MRAHTPLTGKSAIFPILALLFAATAADAQSGWSGVVTNLSPSGGEVDSLQVDMDAAGNAFAAWSAGASVWVARRDADSRVWSPAVLVDGPSRVASLDLFVEREGNAAVAWIRTGPGGGPGSIEYSRYFADDGAWTTKAVVPDVTAALYPEVVIDRTSSMTVVWYQFDQPSFTYNLLSRRHHRPGGWDEIRTIANTGNAAFGPGDRLVVDIEGFATVAWTHVNSATNRSTTFVARTSISTPQHAWGTPAPLANGEQGNPAHLIIDRHDNVIAYWVRSSGSARDLHFTRFVNDQSTWTAVRSIPDARDVQDEHMAVDASGNLIALWSTSFGGNGRVQSARLRFDSATWSDYVTLSASDGDADAGMVGVDAAGNAFAVWNRFDGREEVAQASRYVAAAGTWGPAVDLAGLGEDGENVRVAVDSIGNAVVTFHFDNDDDFAEIAQTTEWVAAPAAEPQAPVGLHVVSIDANTVTLGWTVAAGGVVPTGFVLEGGITPGEVLARVPTHGTATTFTFVAPTGAFYVRVRAIAGVLQSAPSNEIRLFVRVPAPPAAPEGLAGAALGTTVSLHWRRGASGGTPQAIILDVAGAIAASLTLPGTAESFEYSGVPAGTYSLSLRAANSFGVSAPSNSVTLTFPGTCAVPGAPSSVAASVVGSVVTLTWTGGGGFATSYRIEAGSESGLSNLATVDTGSLATSFSATAPPATYFVRVRAVNGCGASAPSAEIIVAIGGVPGA